MFNKRYFLLQRSLSRFLGGLFLAPLNWRHHSKNKTTKHRFGECYACFESKTKTGVIRILVMFQDAYVQPYHSKGLGESFQLMWLNIGLR